MITSQAKPTSESTPPHVATDESPERSSAGSRTVLASSRPTPVGPITVLAEGDTVIAAGFTDAKTLWERVPSARRLPITEVAEIPGVTDHLDAYLAGDLGAIDKINVEQAGTDLQQETWNGLRRIPSGETRTYTELAAETSKPNAVRAIGSACGRNLIAPIVPCHRALRSDGSLGGYYYGLDVKRWLLAHESATDSAPTLFD